MEIGIERKSGFVGRRVTWVEGRLPYNVSGALAVLAAITSAASFFFWGVFTKDVPTTVGNMRGTALAMLVIAVPMLVGSMILSSRGSLRARFVWLGSLAYIAYNAVMFCFALQFNSFFLLFAALLAVSFWALVTLLPHIDLAAVSAAGVGVPVRAIAVYMLACLVLFAMMWLRDIAPATMGNALPDSFQGTGLTQNPIYVLDFAFTFPLLVIGAAWLWRRRAWGYVIGGMMVVTLTIETAGIAIDQAFGHLHDPSASLGAVPIMGVLTAVGLVFAILFFRGMSASRATAGDAESLSRGPARPLSVSGSPEVERRYLQCSLMWRVSR